MSKSAYSPNSTCAINVQGNEDSEILSLLTMQTPTIAQLGVAIEILAKLGERLNIEAAHSIMQLPETCLGAHYAGNIGTKTMEKIERIKAIANQLKDWREEMWEAKHWDAQQARDTNQLAVFTQPPHATVKPFKLRKSRN